MTDRELLEDAAKAAGIEVWWNGRTCFVLKTKVATHEWNPLTFDADALRLAVRVPRSAVIEEVWVTERTSIAEWERDPYAATRRAIVRAAAEIGRRKDD